jgi:hypothetical protein
MVGKLLELFLVIVVIDVTITTLETAKQVAGLQGIHLCDFRHLLTSSNTRFFAGI